MAEVFRGRATAVGGFEKPVAIKKILPHLSQDNRFVALLIAEAKLLAHLRQRNIVQIYDVGLGEDGGYFLVMEYVDGHDVGAMFERMEKKRERFPLDLALHIGSEVCEALEHAHKATDGEGKELSLVHRDVSPSNIMLSNSGEVKLTDFGIAKKVDHQSAVQNIAGKFAYMSPEQASGKPVGPGSDIYSLAVVIWEMLLGRRLYSGIPELEALKLVREARVQRPREIDPSFSRELEAILMKALAPDPKQRFASASLFGAALRDYRYSAATAGDPTREIQALLKRYFGLEKAGDKPKGEVSKVLKIQTVAGFDPPGTPEASSSPARRIFDNFDAPTVAQSGLGIPGPEPGSPPAAVPAAPKLPGVDVRGNGAARAPVPLPSFDHGDDDETRMLETRRGRRLAGGGIAPVGPDEVPTAASPPVSRERLATPTAKEDGRPAGSPPPASSSPSKTAAGKRKAPAASRPPATSGAASAAPAAAGVAVGAGAGVSPVPAPQRRVMPVQVDSGRRRRMWIVGAIALLVLAIGALAVGRLTRTSRSAPTGPAEAPSAQPASGEALEGPAIKAPVKKTKRRP